MKTPDPPKLTVSSWKDAPRKPAYHADGYFVATKIVEKDGVSEIVWLNDIVIVDDVYADGKLFPSSMSLRSALTTGAHEILHSDNTQTILRFSHRVKEHKAYMAAFEADRTPPEVTLKDPLGYTAGILLSSQSGRSQYIGYDEDPQLYGLQPYEKCVSEFQNEFAASLNGVLVSRQVEDGRNLIGDIRELFLKAAELFGEREALIGGKADLVPYMHFRHMVDPSKPVVSLESGTFLDRYTADRTSRRPTLEAIGSVEDRGRIVDAFLKVLELGAHHVQMAPDVKFPFFEQAATFFGQLPNEIWGIRRRMPPQADMAKEKLSVFACASQELSEDLSDYMFITRRQARRVLNRSRRRVAASHLAAIL